MKTIQFFENKNIISARLKLAREQAKLTQEQLAKELDVGGSTINSWEVKRTEPGIDMLLTLAEFFDISADELIKDEIANGEKWFK